MFDLSENQMATQANAKGILGTNQGDWLSQLGGYFQDRPAFTNGLITAGVGALAGAPAWMVGATGGQAYNSKIQEDREYQKQMYQMLLDQSKLGLDYSKYGLDEKKFGLEEQKFDADQYGPNVAASEVYNTIKSSNQAVRPEYLNAVMREAMAAKQENRQPRYRTEWFETVKPRGIL